MLRIDIGILLHLLHLLKLPHLEAFDLLVVLVLLIVESGLLEFKFLHDRVLLRKPFRRRGLVAQFAFLASTLELLR